jgi:signal transduction histidine kinase
VGAKHDGRIGAERTRILYSNVPLAVTAAGVVLASLIAALVIYGKLPFAVGAGWSAAALACAALLVAFWAAHRRDEARTAHWRGWLRRFRIACLAGGLTCTLIAVIVPHPDLYLGEMFGAMVAGGSVAGALPFLGADLTAYAAYMVPTMAPYVVAPLLERFPAHDGLAVSTAVFMTAMWWVARRSNRQLTQGLRLRFENLDLLEEVSRQKALAEEANAAKSELLAAASHDLRQPLHALGLFVSALRQRRMGREARSLLDRMDHSLLAMDGLFAALLDMTRLNAGAMKAELSMFRLAPLLAGLAQEFAPEVEAKGLRLVIRCGEATVHSDRLLLERIVRNLVANAVRYTDRGGVLVACRRSSRPGQVKVEVWDTGCGVEPDQQERIFREFYQIPRPDRERTQGLGLGLAIVRGAAELLGCPLSLASRPGRGSVFRLEVPLARMREAASPPAPEAAQRGLILVVEDEPEAREAMHGLLAGWGHEVLAASSGSEMLQRLDERRLRPDLIICDWAPGGESGPSAIEALRAHVGADVPAMVVTGERRSGRRVEAEAAGLLLLAKPVSNSRLRAAVGNLMRRTAG